MGSQQIMEEIELEPCPFCGGKAIQRSDPLIYCENVNSCGANIDWGHFFGRNAKESRECRKALAEAWNRRSK